MALTSNTTPPNGATHSSVVKSVEKRVEHLIADHRRLSVLNSELRKQRDALLISKKELQQRVVELERELSMSDLKGGLVVSTRSSARARAYVNRLMREVDSCITLITSPGASEEMGSREEMDDK